MTHVLLPVFVLVRRADAVEVVGAALEARAGGAGVRAIAAGLGRPMETVRGWLRRMSGRLEPARGWFTAVAVRVSIDPVPPGPAGSAWADLVTAIAAAARAVRDRFGSTPSLRGPGWVWLAAGAMSSGRLLAPSWPGARTV